MREFANSVSRPLDADRCKRTFRVLALGAALLAAMFVTVGNSTAEAASRHCKAAYVWETTGGSISGSFSPFEGRGTCGSAVPNRCRERARDAISRCARVHWDKRWDRDVPEACVNTGTNSTVKNYSTRLTCQRAATSQPSQCYVQGITQPSGSNVSILTEVIAKNGDIKTRLEGEVCCAYKGGNHKFQNNRKIHVRLKYRSWGDNRCSRTETLSNDYEINCQSFRQKYCRHQNNWD